ncbi:MAG TPA: hypothetical protein VK837_07070 [Longimicrobiales bacterium]|nr:hypothetical protein [Longimicrobiales bacterium]
MDYPLTLNFKILSIAPQIRVRDAHGDLVFYVHQKAFKLREAITVFGDEARTRALATVAADRIIDFSAAYSFTGADGRAIGSLRRRGMRSLWKAHYDIAGPDGTPSLRISEDNAMVKFFDGIFREIPLLNLLSGYVFNPTYSVYGEDDRVVFRMRKRPSFLETAFTIEEVADLPVSTEALVVLSLLTMVLLERSRG